MFIISLLFYSILLGMASLPLITVYPLMKRYTFWPQAVLGEQEREREGGENDGNGGFILMFQVLVSIGVH